MAPSRLNTVVGRTELGLPIREVSVSTTMGVKAAASATAHVVSVGSQCRFAAGCVPECIVSVSKQASGRCGAITTTRLKVLDNV